MVSDNLLMSTIALFTPSMAQKQHKTPKITPRRPTLSTINDPKWTFSPFFDYLDNLDHLHQPAIKNTLW